MASGNPKDEDGDLEDLRAMMTKDQIPSRQQRQGKREATRAKKDGVACQPERCVIYRASYLCSPQESVGDLHRDKSMIQTLHREW